MKRILVYLIWLLIPVAFVHADFQISNKSFQSSGYFNVLVPSTTAAPGIIDYVEYGTITLAASSSSGTYTLGRSYPSGYRSVFKLGNDHSITTATADDVSVTLKFTDATTITATRFASTARSGTTTVSFAAVEWDTQAIQSIQTFDIQQFGTTNKTQAITAVNASSTALNVTGYTSTSTVTFPRQISSTITLNSSTQITSEKLTSAHGVTTTVEVIEFKPDVISSIQSVNISLTGTTNTTATINSVTLGRTMVTYRGSRSSGTTMTSTHCYAELQDSTTVSAVRATATNNCIVGLDIIEFNSGYASYATNTENIISSALVATSTISVTNLTKSLINYLGASVGTGNVSAAMTRCTLYSATEIPCRRTVSTSIATTSLNIFESN